MWRKINLPTYLTIFRIFMVPILVVVLLTRIEGKEIIGIIVFWLASITDFFDGYLARKRKQITPLGQLLDPLADKLLIAGAFISLVELKLAPAWMVVIIIGREFAVNGLRQIATTYKIVMPASFWGKLKTVMQMAAISFLILGEKYLILKKTGIVSLWLVLFVSIASGIDYFYKFYQRAGDTLFEEKGEE